MLCLIAEFQDTSNAAAAAVLAVISVGEGTSLWHSVYERAVHSAARSMQQVFGCSVRRFLLPLIADTQTALAIMAGESRSRMFRTKRFWCCCCGAAVGAVRPWQDCPGMTRHKAYVSCICTVQSLLTPAARKVTSICAVCLPTTQQ